MIETWSNIFCTLNQASIIKITILGGSKSHRNSLEVFLEGSYSVESLILNPDYKHIAIKNERRYQTAQLFKYLTVCNLQIKIPERTFHCNYTESNTRKSYRALPRFADKIKSA